MIYNIAICDDEKGTCAKLEELTASIFDKLSLQHNIDVFYSGEEFVNYMSQGHKYTFILLDIELYEMSGVNASERFVLELPDRPFDPADKYALRYLTRHREPEDQASLSY